MFVGFTPADQATNNDYDDERQKALLGADRFSGIENRFLGKGHLTPDGISKKMKIVKRVLHIFIPTLHRNGSCLMQGTGRPLKGPLEAILTVQLFHQ